MGKKKKETKITLGTLYDFNKQAMSKEEPLADEDFCSKTNEMIQDIYNTGNKYWMLLCRERNDFTVFITFTAEGTYKEMLDTLQNRGQVLSIDKLEDGNYEIWIRDPETKDNFAYYFFNYYYGIIEA